MGYLRPDALSAALRCLSFIALFQAAGMALFLAVFGRLLESSPAPLRRVARLSAITAVVLLLGQYALEAARMADDFLGVLDASLQKMVLDSNSSVVLAARVLGLTTLAMAAGRRDDVGVTFNVVGALVVSASFILTGHTAVHPLRWALAPLLLIHVTIVAFWFGALVPLYIASACETPAIAARVTAAFSRIAGWLVPAIPAAGLLLALVLIRHVAEFRLPYGVSLLGKVGGFSLLMGFAAWNKWRLGPAIASGDIAAARWFRRSLAAEYALISGVLGITAIMTTFYSPAN